MSELPHYSPTTLASLGAITSSIARRTRTRAYASRSREKWRLCACSFVVSPSHAPRDKKITRTKTQTTFEEVTFACHFSATHCYYYIKDEMPRFLPFLLAIFVSFAAAQNSTSNSTTDGWGGCVFPNDPTKSTDVKIGEPTPICITVGPGGSWAAGVPYIRWVFTPVADQYSYFRIPDCEFILLKMLEYRNHFVFSKPFPIYRSIPRDCQWKWYISREKLDYSYCVTRHVSVHGHALFCP